MRRMPLVCPRGGSLSDLRTIVLVLLVRPYCKPVWDARGTLPGIQSDLMSITPVDLMGRYYPVRLASVRLGYLRA